MKEAAKLALMLSGGTPEIMLVWLNPTTIKAPDTTHAMIKEMDMSSDWLRESEMEGVIDLQHMIFIDYLTASSGENDMHEEVSEEVFPPVRFVWEAPKVWLILFVPNLSPNKLIEY